MRAPPAAEFRRRLRDRLAANGIVVSELWQQLNGDLTAMSALSRDLNPPCFDAPEASERRGYPWASTEAAIATAEMTLERSFLAIQQRAQQMTRMQKEGSIDAGVDTTGSDEGQKDIESEG
ncbi:MAG: hypothetical protein V1778_03980 [bacterium]